MAGIPSLVWRKFPRAMSPLWHIVDARGYAVGRLAQRIAILLMGKHKPSFTPNIDMGDFIVVYNAERVIFTGNKWQQKTYKSHSGYPGGFKEIRAKDKFAKQPDDILYQAIRGQLPKNKLRNQRMERVRIFVGPRERISPHLRIQAENNPVQFDFGSRAPDVDRYGRLGPNDKGEVSKEHVMKHGGYAMSIKETSDEDGEKYVVVEAAQIRGQDQEKEVLESPAPKKLSPRMKRIQRHQRIKQILDKINSKTLPGKNILD
eukprot:TRINITY_DN1757_c0_g1_i1.p1 TRINITY_DN1757_c0_g1~~TRINITY_DN1757_c0_g1_i1.p1  ORF type:complete len:287 (+),score=41.88 TRINITY_DN1757_c0_g1_i1:84-863(+)